MNKNMLSKIVALADQFDQEGMKASADIMDSFLRFAADNPHWFKDKDKDTVYFEESGVTRSALASLNTVMKHHAKDIVKAEFVKEKTDREGFEHVKLVGLILTDKSGTKFVIPAGFAEGYSGEGPRGFDEAKTTLKNNKISFSEREVSPQEFEKLFHTPHRERFKKDSEKLGDEETSKRWTGDRRK